MPRRPPRPCTYPRCRQYATNGSRCDEHQVRHRWDHGGRTRHDRGYGTAWERLRLQVLERDSHLCLECLRAGIFNHGRNVDHIVPKSQGGGDELSNLQTLCDTCHTAKTQAEAKAGK